MSVYKIGDIITGKVTGIENYGIFLSLKDKSSGLIHISEISSKFVKDVSDYAKVGEILNAKVIGKDENNHYRLSIKDFEENESSNRSRKIIETSKGFNTLGSMLPNWIDNKTRQIEENNKKHN